MEAESTALLLLLLLQQPTLLLGDADADAPLIAPGDDDDIKMLDCGD